MNRAIELLERGVVALEAIAKSLKAAERVVEAQANPRWETRVTAETLREWDSISDRR